MKTTHTIVFLLALCLAAPFPSTAQNPGPDLVIASVTASATRVGVGETFEYVVRAKNIGGLPCNQVKLSLAFPDTIELVASRADSPLTCEATICRGGLFYLLWGGQSFSATYTMKARAAGVPTATATIDPDGVCSEAKESNNAGTSPPVTIVRRPHLVVAAGRPSTRTSIQQVTQVFPLTITNVGDGPATDIVLTWSANLGDLGPMLLAATTGHPAVSHPFDCLPLRDSMVCTIRATLQPQQALQASIRFAACVHSVNPEIQVSTADDVSGTHRVFLNGACPRPHLTLSAHPVRPPSSNLSSVQNFPLTITNTGDGPAQSVALAWSSSLGARGPRLVSAYTGQRVPAGQQQPPSLTLICLPVGGNPTICIIEIFLRPQETIQANVTFATCQDFRLNAEVRALTNDDLTSDHQSVSLHAACRP